MGIEGTSWGVTFKPQLSVPKSENEQSREKNYTKLSADASSECQVPSSHGQTREKEERSNVLNAGLDTLGQFQVKTLKMLDKKPASSDTYLLGHPVSPLPTSCSLHNCCQRTYSLTHEQKTSPAVPVSM